MFDVWHGFPTCFTKPIAVLLSYWNLPVWPYRDIQYVPSDRFDIWAFHRSGHACQVLTRRWHSFLINCTMPLLACVCPTTSVAWLTHQFKVAWFVGCPAAVTTALPSSPIPPPFLPAVGIEAFSHAWEAFSSQHAAGLYYSEMAITEWFKGNIETLDTLLLCVYSWRLTAQHMNLKQMRGERQRCFGQELVGDITETAHYQAAVLQSALFLCLELSGTGFAALWSRLLGSARYGPNFMLLSPETCSENSLTSNNALQKVRHFYMSLVIVD